MQQRGCEIAGLPRAVLDKYHVGAGPGVGGRVRAEDAFLREQFAPPAGGHIELQRRVALRAARLVPAPAQRQCQMRRQTQERGGRRPRADAADNSFTASLPMTARRLRGARASNHPRGRPAKGTGRCLQAWRDGRKHMRVCVTCGGAARPTRYSTARNSTARGHRRYAPFM